jgi:hypothetical protein
MLSLAPAIEAARRLTSRTPAFRPWCKRCRLLACTVAPACRRLSLADALCGTVVQLQTLDGRTLTVPVQEVVSPQAEKVVAGEGMPLTKSPGQRGFLRIRCGRPTGTLWSRGPALQRFPTPCLGTHVCIASRWLPLVQALTSWAPVPLHPAGLRYSSPAN